MKKVHVVPHTHWDREWYFTIEDSNSLLIEHMDYLIEYLENNIDYPHFVFDGQLSVIEEYLKYRKENKDRLEKLISEKRILIGPWYTQCDTFNPKLESVIRNLQYGIYLGREYGHVMNVGYLPDAFGQNAYLPSIFKNCGLDFSIMQRGISNTDAQKGINFIWKSPNGESIKTNYIFFGYGPGKFLEPNKEYMDNKLKPILDKLNDFSFDNDILLPSGGDQALIRTHFKDTVKELSKLSKEYNFELSNYETFMENINFEEVNQIEGEHYTPQKSRVHRTIHSQRADLKILNLKVEKKLIEILEPLMAMAFDLGIKINTVLQDEIWKSLFDAHAHDSIAGCNSDATNERIIARLKSIDASIDGQINILKKKITKRIALDENVLVLFNFEQVKNKKVRAKIFTKEKTFNLIQENSLIDYFIVDFKEIDGGSKVEVTANGERQVKLPPYYETTIEFERDFENIGYQTFKIIEVEKEVEEKIYKKVNLNSIQNNNYKINISKNIEIESFESEEKVILAFELQSDFGDSYDFAFVEDETPIVCDEISNIEIFESKIEYKILFDNILKLNKKEVRIKSTLTLGKDSAVVDIKNEIINEESNIRVRALFIKNINDKFNIADSGMGVVKRDNVHIDINTWKEKNYAEMPLAIYPFERFFSVDNFSIVNSNVKEYQILDSAIALTLYRTVEVLGRDNLSTRPGRASGINNVVVYTNDAQMLNIKLEIEYSIFLGNVKTDEKFNLYDIYSKINKNYDVYQNQILNLFENRIDRFEMPGNSIKLPEKFNLFTYQSSHSYLSSVRLNNLRKIEYRIFNPHNIEDTIKFESEIMKTNLVSDIYEKNVTKLDLKQNYITLMKEDKC